MAVVNVAEIAKRYREKSSFEMSKKDSIAEVKLIAGIIADALVEGDAVRLQEFGLFPAVRAAGKMKDPKTGEERTYPEKKVIKLRTYTALKERLNPPKPKNEPKAKPAKGKSAKSGKAAKGKTKGGKK